MHEIHLAENLAFLANQPHGSVDLIYIDPPFNTGALRSLTRLKTVQAADGDRRGFQGKSYRTTRGDTRSYEDSFEDFPGFLRPRLLEAHRVLARHGTLYVHLDYREVHYIKILLDGIFGREGFLNELIWAYDYGARTTKKWPPKHDSILVYVKDPRSYYFDMDAVDRIPYMAPGLVGPEKAARGKTPTDTWWHTIVPTNGRERTGYPTQKPVGILRRIVAASSRKGGTVLDFFAGSGSTGEACLLEGRRFILVDRNPEAIEVMARRFAAVRGIQWHGCPAPKARPAGGRLFGDAATVARGVKPAK